MTMFKPKTSMSPVKFGSESPTKRANESSPTRNGESSGRANKKIKVDQEPKFTFEEVKSMIDNLLVHKSKAATVSAGLKHVDFKEVAVPGHSVQNCEKLITKLVSMTRRIRTFEEVLTDIKTNLNKRSYTEAIQRATLQVAPPRRPPSAYLMYHKERFEALKQEIPQASEIAKIVSEEWRNLEDRKRQTYLKRHNELLKKWEREIKKLGLVNNEKPKKARSAKALFIQSKLDELDDYEDMEKDEQAQTRERFAQEFDEADKELRSYWNKRYTEEQERYRQEQNEYIAAHPHLDHHVPERQSRATKSLIKPPPGPKSALKHYLAKKIPEGLEGQEFEDLKIKLKDKFQKLSDKKQLKFIKKAIRDKERYDQEVAEFKTEHPDVVIPKIKPTITKDQWKLYQTLVENKPSVPAPTTYLHYCGKVLSDSQGDADQVPTQRMQFASQQWSSMSDKDRVEIEKDHMDSIKSYVSEMDAWLLTQDEEKRDRVLREEPKSRPDYWRRKLTRMERLAKKR